MRKYIQIVLWLGIASTFLSCNTRTVHEPPPSVELLATDANFSIGRRIVRIPLVAIASINFPRSKAAVLCENKSDEFCNLSLDEIREKQPTPISVKALDISVNDYSYLQDAQTDTYISMPELCPMLSQQWAKEICLNRDSPVFGEYLRSFTLMNSDYLKYADISWIGNTKKSAGELVRELELEIGQPQRVCPNEENGQPSSLCVATLKLDNDLLAVWIVTRSQGLRGLTKDSEAIQTLVELWTDDATDGNEVS
ncbi:hypothetical protein VKI21_03900 [Cyanobacterium aponinum UTEX 3222]|uniref:hypothetical protein n=1 Tax=Cyanobacterium aponinum TaxID=379064 RepID=UPI00308E94C8|nr:hypothetical protein VKI21_03900 [Cyanobacterium aponinum UTEX 3222]